MNPSRSEPTATLRWVPVMDFVPLTGPSSGIPRIKGVDLRKRFAHQAGIAARGYLGGGSSSVS